MSFDFNKVKLVSHSKFVETDLNLSNQIAYVARVSNPNNQMNTLTASKLMNYLIKNKHWSPFEMVNIVLEVETTRDISRQILRHRSFSFQEFSQRYADPVEALGFVERECRLQDEHNRQNSIKAEDEGIKQLFSQIQKEIIELENKHYIMLLENGVAKEQARCVLSEGLTKSRMYISGSLRSWIHYVEVRTDKSTQKEHRDLAIKIAYCLADIFPQILSFVSN